MSDYNWENEGSNFKGYYLKIGDCNFTTPAIKREGFKVLPNLVMVTDEQRVASGKLIMKPLKHKPAKLEVTLPLLTRAQYRYYNNALRGVLTNEDEMYLTVEFYDESSDSYREGTFYHTDLKYTPVIYGGERMIQFDTFSLIEH